MTRVKPIILLLAAIMIALPFSGCGRSAAPKLAGISLTDMAGREISLEAPVEKTVALTASDCEIIYALGAGDCLVGRGEYCDYPAEALGVPSVQSGQNTNIEQIVALKPQAVFMSKMAQTDEQIAAIEAAGVPVIVSGASDIEGVYSSIGLIGAALGKDSEAEALVAQMKSGFADIRAKAGQPTEKKTVYFEVSPLEYGLWTAGKGTFMDEIAVMLGLENAFSDVDGWAEISQEQVIERNPDYIVTVTMYFGDGPRPEDEIMAREGWQNIRAVADGNVFPADSDEITRPGPRLVDAAEMLYALIYG